MRESVRDAELQAVAHLLLHMRLERVIGGIACCLISHGIDAVPDVRNTQIRVAAIVGVVWLGGQIVSVRVRCLVAVVVDFAVYWLCRTGEKRLIERDGNDAMPSAIAN